ncbi:4Fe-4S dicluster domain-containing protein [Vampirovibrio sp.]|uniref:4Fe-4S dicluster domain-containing protein n=1 Tax=Vampirovibrio sp. TaxID=2717857 RepID=UPI00359415CC
MAERIEYDVLLVGGSPSNLALAHHLVDLAKQSGVSFTMAILEKGKEFGAHILSGAVSKPHVIQKLFPDYQENGFPYEAVCSQSGFSVLANKSKWDVPAALLPAGLKKEGYLVLTLSHVVYWMANKLKEKLADTPNVVMDFFPGFSAHEIVYDGDKVVGVQVVEKASGDTNEDNIYGKVTCFGDKGFVSRDIISRFHLRDTPQIWSVGVKEVWELPEGKDYMGQVWHTMGFPLVDGSFGGGFIYGMKDRKLTIGMVISLDSPNPNINPQQKLQDYKKHPWVQSLIKDGKMLKYGAALLPEGGYYSLPKKFAVDGAILLGDALGVLDISQLSGVDKSMECGWQAAEVLHEALQSGNFSETHLATYQQRVMDSFVGQNLYEGRYFRKAWQENPRLLGNYLPKVMEGVDAGNPYWGLVSVGLTHNPVTAVMDALRLKNLMDGKTDMGPVKYEEDYKHIVPNFKVPRTITTQGFVKDTVYSRADAVFYAGTKYHEENRHIDEFNSDVCIKCISTYDALGKETPCVSDCTAEVHRVDERSGLRHHGMSLENCVQCRTCEIVCPEVNLKVRPTEEGSGPDFMGL